MEQKINDGFYKARVTDHGWVQGSNNKDYAKVWFTLESGEKVPWFGFLTEKSRKRTAETLVLLGFEKDDLIHLNTKDALDKETTFNVKVVTETFNDLTMTKVCWVGIVKEKFAAPDNSLAADLMAARQKKINDLPNEADKLKSKEPQFDPDEEIPF